MEKYLYTGATVGTLAGGAPVVPGSVVELTAELATKRHNKRMIRDGLLLPLPASKKPRKVAAKKESVEGKDNA